MISNFVMMWSQDMMQDCYKFTVKFNSSESKLFKKTVQVPSEYMNLLYDPMTAKNYVLGLFSNKLINHPDYHEVLYMINSAFSSNEPNSEYDVYNNQVSSSWATGGPIGDTDYDYFATIKKLKGQKPLLNSNPFTEYNQKLESITVEPTVDLGLSGMARQLPGINEIAKCPCGDHDGDDSASKSTVFNVIIHLNDIKKWTREQIADWLETLDVNLKFKTPTKENENVQA